MNFKHLLLLSTIFLLAICAPAQAQKKSRIYKKDWIDLNKNGIKDIYEDPEALIEDRIEDLLSRMTMEEKTCQMVTLYGYGRVLKDSLPTPGWKNELWKDGLGALDEHLNGFRGWGKAPMDLDICVIPSKHAEAMNTVQRFFIEETRLGIPVDFTNEGIRGIENYVATNFPTQLAIGHTWNKELVYQIGKITGMEARALGYTNVYAPILDVGRDQRWGRMEEVYSESPYLVAELGISMTKGLQKDYQVAATAKHFALYSQNKGAREGFARVDPQMSPREAENIHFYPFKRVIQEANILGVMSSYNDYDGIPIQGSYFYLTQKLRNEFGFKGYVVSDSDAVIYLYNKHKTAKDYKEAVRQSVEAGLNVRCTFRSPESYVNPLRELMAEGGISERVINDRVRDVLRVKFMTGMFDKPYIENTKEADKIVNCPGHQDISLQASRESIVLLKNENNLLPLDRKKIKSIAVCGPNANDGSYALTHYGPLAVEVSTVLDGIRQMAGNSIEVNYTKGCELVDANWPDSELLPTEMTDEVQSEIAKAVAITEKSDISIVVVGGSQRTCGENKSRSSLNLPGHQLNLIRAVYATGKPVVVVVISGRPLSINWTAQNIPAILQAFYPGSKGGKAIGEVLFGDYNPGGKLTVTIPKTAGQIPFNFPNKPNAQLDAWGQAGLKGDRARVNGALYEFGHGLSYTTFTYSGLSISPKVITPNQDVKVTFKVSNTGKRAGDEVVQLYIRDIITSVTTYEKTLRGFDRIHLNPGETKELSFTIRPEDLELLDLNMKRVVEPGMFKVMIGASSEDIKLDGQFEVASINNIHERKSAKETLDNSFKYLSSDKLAPEMINLIDGDLKTDCQISNGCYLNFELKDKAVPSFIKIALKQNAVLEVQLSSGGGQFMTVFKDEVKVTNKDFSSVNFKGFPTSDLRILFHGPEDKKTMVHEVVADCFKGNK